MFRTILMALALVAGLSGFGQNARADTSGLFIGDARAFDQTPLSLSGRLANPWRHYLEIGGGMLLTDETVRMPTRSPGRTFVDPDRGGDGSAWKLEAGTSYTWPSGFYTAASVGFGISDHSSKISGADFRYRSAVRGWVEACGHVGWTPRSGMAVFYGTVCASAFNVSDEWMVMPTVGLGARVGFSERWYAFLEYRYSNHNFAANGAFEINRAMAGVGRTF